MAHKTQRPQPVGAGAAGNSKAIDAPKVPQPRHARKPVTRRAVQAELQFLAAAKAGAR